MTFGQLKAYAWQFTALGLAVLLFLQTDARHAAELGAQTAQTTLATVRGNAHRAELAASEKNRKLEGEHRETVSKIRADAKTALAAATADADSARAAGQRLLGDLAAYIEQHRVAAIARAAAGQCAPDTAPLELLADLQRRADARAGELASIADEARARGHACERTHDSARTMNQAAGAH